MLSTSTLQQRQQFQQAVMASSSTATQAPSSGSRTMTVTPSANPSDESSSNPIPDTPNIPRTASGVLRLRGGPRSRAQVAWTEDVIDNEGLGRKKSKSAFWHPRAFDESSSEESSGSSDKDSESDGGHPGGKRPAYRHHHHHHHDDGGDGPKPEKDGGDGAAASAKNAYDSAPGDRKGKGKQ